MSLAMTDKQELLEQFAPNTEFTDHLDLYYKVVELLIAEAEIIIKGEVDGKN